MKLYVRVCVCVCAFVCTCLCQLRTPVRNVVRVQYLCGSVYMCVCVCICVYVLCPECTYVCECVCATYACVPVFTCMCVRVICVRVRAFVCIGDTFMGVGVRVACVARVSMSTGICEHACLCVYAVCVCA